MTMFPAVTLLTVDEVLGGWDAVTTHLADGGILDKALEGAATR